MLPQLERQFLQCNLSQARTLLAQSAPDEDVIEHFQYAQLVQELENKLALMPDQIEQAPAGVALFFGGRPVVGSQGIRADFGSKAIDRFQSLVSQRFAAEELGPLAPRGPVPLKEITHLLVTDVVRGSFGFVLQGAQADDPSQSMGTTLKAVVDKVADTLSRVASQDDAMFDEAVAEIDERQKGALTDFFKLLDSEGATMRIVEGERDFELDQASVQRARRRVESLEISDKTQEFKGQVLGWTDFSAKFELRPYGSHEVLQGSVSAGALERVAAEGIEPYHKHIRATIKIREVKARNRQTKTVYTLISLEQIAPPADWPAQAVQSAIS